MKIKNLSQVILNLNICTIFIFVSMYVLKFILPIGYTTEFLVRGYKLISLFILPLSILFLISIIFTKDFKLKNKIDFPNLKDIALLALPMSPIISFVILNIEYLNVLGLTYVIMIPLIFSLIFSFILPSLLSYFGSYQMLMISGIAFSFTILNMAQITNNPTTHFFGSQFITQGLYLIVSFVIVYSLYSLNKYIAFTAVIVFMISGAIISFLDNPFKKNSDLTQNDERLKLFKKNDDNKIINTKNIYVLIFESYSNFETLKFYGYDNSNQLNFLRDKGFTIYQGSYSNGAKSLSSTSRILELKNELSKDDRYYLNGNSFVLNVFKSNGYKTVGLFKSPYSFGSAPISWDEYYPKDDVSKIGGKTILKAIYEGYFRFVFPPILLTSSLG